jgi:hypothetical protein
MRLWVEYKPSALRAIVPHDWQERIAEFLASLESSDIDISLADEVWERSESPSASM